MLGYYSNIFVYRKNMSKQMNNSASDMGVGQFGQGFEHGLAASAYIGGGVGKMAPPGRTAAPTQMVPQGMHMGGGGVSHMPQMVPMMLAPTTTAGVGGSGRGQGQGNRSYNRAESITRTIPVPSDNTGFVIGGGGKTVKAIKGRTQTTIRHFDADPAKNRPYPYFSVRGTPQGVCDAILEIHGLMLESQRRMGGGGGGGVGVGGGGPSSPEYTPSSPTYVPTE